MLGVTQETVDVYLQEIIKEGVDLAAEADAVKLVLSKADKIDQSLSDHGSMLVVISLSSLTPRIFTGFQPPQENTKEGLDLSVEADAAKLVLSTADKIDKSLSDHDSMLVVNSLPSLTPRIFSDFQPPQENTSRICGNFFFLFF